MCCPTTATTGGRQIGRPLFRQLPATFSQPAAITEALPEEEGMGKCQRHWPSPKPSQRTSAAAHRLRPSHQTNTPCRVALHGAPLRPVAAASPSPAPCNNVAFASLRARAATASLLASAAQPHHLSTLHRLRHIASVRGPLPRHRASTAAAPRAGRRLVASTHQPLARRSARQPPAPTAGQGAPLSDTRRSGRGTPGSGPSERASPIGVVVVVGRQQWSKRPFRRLPRGCNSESARAAAGQGRRR